ncbi:YraN family protein [Cutibacterium sp.]|uniref:YraN family protein n=1 Tax=Cutibacterium sp. TaxID=1912221 RepID=UPI0026DBD44A|nr:YraN family protein [Cutibacterium sp.]MDO4413260.1 YraN family protein [Cutibacterium sp.]
MMTPKPLSAELTTPRGAALRGRRGGRPAFGAWGEDIAAEYLESLGWTIIARNWACDVGEIDLIAHDDQTVVIVEVKTRSGTGFGDPLESITKTKVRKLNELALAWLVNQEDPVHSIRIDAIGVMARPGEQPTITHVRGIR